MNFAVNRVRFAEMLFGFGLAFVIGAALWIGREFLESPEAPQALSAQSQATVLAEPIAVPTFNLVDQHENAFTQASLLGQWSLLFFGYTHCPDVCPTTINLLVQMEQQLQQAAPDKPKYVFVSIDPDRDTPSHLAQYMAYFHADFLGVSGAQKQLQAITQPLGIYYQKELPDLEGNYAFKHSSAILLVNPDGKVHALMSPPHDPVAMATDYQTILARWPDTRT